MPTPSAEHALRMLRTCSLAMLLAGFLPGPGYPDGPPPAHTGGFGEPTCTDCHDDFDANSGTGDLVISGFPDRVSPRVVYEIKVFLRQEGMARAGFQLSVRTGKGDQAGRFSHPTPRSATSSADGIDYAGHTDAGSRVEGDSTEWSVRWIAPDSLSSDIVLHVAANAGNGDDSPLGDRIYAGSWSAHAP